MTSSHLNIILELHCTDHKLQTDALYKNLIFGVIYVPTFDKTELGSNSQMALIGLIVLIIVSMNGGECFLAFRFFMIGKLNIDRQITEVSYCNVYKAPFLPSELTGLCLTL